jgi:hypothetical protein
LSDRVCAGIAELKRALEAKELAGGVARLHNAVGDERERAARVE